MVDTGGCPLSDVDVEFVAPTSGAGATFPGSATTATVASGPDGVATAPSLTANQVSGSYMVLAEVPSTGYKANFAFTNTTSGVAAGARAGSGGGQSAKVGAQFSVPLVVNVVDAYGTPVGEANVGFTIIPANGRGASFVGGGRAPQLRPIPRAPLPARCWWPVRPPAPSPSRPASAGSANRSPSRSQIVPRPRTTITPGSGTAQEAQLGTDFAVPLAVTVTDVNDNPVAGAKGSLARAWERTERRLRRSRPGRGGHHQFERGGSSAQLFRQRGSRRVLGDGPGGGPGQHGHFRDGQCGPVSRRRHQSSPVAYLVSH